MPEAQRRASLTALLGRANGHRRCTNYIDPLTTRAIRAHGIECFAKLGADVAVWNFSFDGEESGAVHGDTYIQHLPDQIR